MRPRIRCALFGCLALFVAVCKASPPVLLQNFDLEPADELESLEQVDLSDFDKDGDLEARCTATGRKNVFRLKLKRNGSLLKKVNSGEQPVLKLTAFLPEGFAPLTTPKLFFVVQTNAVVSDGKDGQVYGRVAMKPKQSQIESAKRVFSVNLKQAVLQSGESVADMIEKFEKGAGTFFMVTVMQATAEDEVLSVIYDDIMLASAETPEAQRPQ